MSLVGIQETEDENVMAACTLVMSAFRGDTTTNPGSRKGRFRRDLSDVVLGGIYRLESKHAGWGMGEIWSARHIELGTQWLVKLLPSELAEDRASNEALLREAKVTANLPGSFFPSVVHVGVSDGITFYVMEALEGRNLGQLLEEEYAQGMVLAETVPLLEQILEAMALAHREGVTHCDIKPDNVFVEMMPGQPRGIRILDFGVAEVQGNAHSIISPRLPQGTRKYMPPEGHAVTPGDSSAAGDVFAIGLTAYHMILGRRPLEGSDNLAGFATGKELGRLADDRVGKKAGVSAELSDVLSKAVRLDPEKRYPDAGAMLKALRFALEFRPGDISAGTILDNAYRVVGKLAEGGMGAVYAVEDVHRRVEKQQVLKILTYPPGCKPQSAAILRERFRRECTTLHNLQDSAIPYIYANGSHEGTPFLVMERAQGETLGKSFHRLLAMRGWSAVFSMARQVAGALDAVHAKGIIHRDIKPSNIVVDPDTAKAVVLDFGIARLSDTKLTAIGSRIGTPGFSSPEQVMCRPVTASDQWSFAACFYALLSNRRPGSHDKDREARHSKRALSLLVDERVMGDEVQPFSELKALVPVPDTVAQAIEKAMSHESEDRFLTVTAFVNAMEGGVVDTAAPALVPQAETERVLQSWLAQSVAPKTIELSTADLLPLEDACDETIAMPGQRCRIPGSALWGFLVTLAALGGGYALWQVF